MWPEIGTLLVGILGIAASANVLSGRRSRSVRALRAEFELLEKVPEGAARDEFRVEIERRLVQLARSGSSPSPTFDANARMSDAEPATGSPTADQGGLRPEQASEEARYLEATAIADQVRVESIDLEERRDFATAMAWLSGMAGSGCFVVAVVLSEIFAGKNGDSKHDPWGAEVAVAVLLVLSAILIGGALLTVCWWLVRGIRFRLKEHRTFRLLVREFPEFM